MNFNKKQQEAINFYKGSCGVIASAGSGKSTVLLNRIKNLIQTHRVSEKDILAISFTRNTADELKNKLKDMGLMMVNVGTFHSICASILAQGGMYLSQDKMIKEWQIEKLFHNDAKKVDVLDVMGFISYQKNYLKSYNDPFMVKDSNYSESDLRIYFEMYEDFKKKNGLHDFDDYLVMCYEFLKKNSGKYTYEFILVDEHQDSNLVQNLILKELCASGNMFTVYDFRQAIFQFRGGSPEYCMNFDKDWNASIINMNMNYRSAKNIVERSNHFIRQYYGDYEHYSDSVSTRDSEGNIEISTYYDKEEEAKESVNKIDALLKSGANPNEITVLYRLNSQSFYIEHELRQRNIDYHIVNDSSFFKRKEITGILAYLKLILDIKDDGAMMEIFDFRNYPFTFFSNKVIGEIKKLSNEDDISMYEALQEARYDNNWQKDSVRTFVNIISKLKRQKGKNTLDMVNSIIKAFQIEDYIENKYPNEDEKSERKYSLDVLRSFVRTDVPEKFIEYVETTDKKKSKKDCLKLMTIHASKGLEFENVFLIGVEDDKFPHKKSDMLDEARLFYVGVTRPKDNLYISQIGEGNKFVKEYVGDGVGSKG